jgi:hypothetical protein
MDSMARALPALFYSVRTYIISYTLYITYKLQNLIYKLDILED